MALATVYGVEFDDPLQHLRNGRHVTEGTAACGRCQGYTVPSSLGGRASRALAEALGQHRCSTIRGSATVLTRIFGISEGSG